MKYVTYLKNNWHIVVLIAILVLGLKLRLYHIDYPSIGYHNMKENEYLNEAQIMLETNDFIHTRVRWQGLSENDYIQEALPVLPWLTVIFWKIFGTHLAIPRMFIVLSSLGAIWLTYMIAFKLSNNKYLALTSALLMSFMPLGVFFGRNVQPDMPALMLTLLFTYYFIKWLETRSRNDFILFSAAVALTGLIKITNLIGLVALVFLIPYKDILKNYKKYIPLAAIFFVILLSIPAWMLVTKLVTPTEYGIWSPRGTPLFEVFTPGYWQENGKIIISYYAVHDNFTAWYLWFAFFGFIFAAMKYKSKFSRFMFGYILAMVPYGVILTNRIAQHNYYQMPFLALICFLSALFFFNLGAISRQIVLSFVKNKELGIAASLIPLLLILLTVGSVRASINVQFDQQYIGYDEAGKYIQSHSEPEERVFLEGISAGQGASLFGHASRFGTWMPKNISEFKRGEDEKNFRWVVLYNQAWRQGIDEGIFMIAQKPEIWQYIQDNYQLKQVGYIGSTEQPVRIYMVLEKGGRLNDSTISNVPQLAVTYELTSAQIPLYTVE